MSRKGRDDMYIRESARAIILNEFGEILLQRFEFKNVQGNKVLWVTPGGGIEKSETTENALIRELYEELHLNVSLQGHSPVLNKDVLIHGKSEDFISRETYYKLLIKKATAISLKNMTANESDTFKDIKWWKKEDLMERQDFAPREILDYF